MSPNDRLHFPPGTGIAFLQLIRMQVILLATMLWVTASARSLGAADDAARADPEQSIFTLAQR